MKNYFPNQNGYLQTNRSDRLGSLWSTFNLDFQSKLGTMRLAQKLVTNTTSSDDADLGRPTAFELFNNFWFAIAGTRIFVTGTNDGLVTTAFEEDASTGFQTDYASNFSDLAIFDARLWSTTTDNLQSLSGYPGGTWTSRDALQSGVVHKMVYFKKFNRLYYIDTNSAISSIDSSNAVVNAPGNYYIDIGNSIGKLTTLVATTDSIWIGTKVDTDYGFSMIGQWDGFSSQLTNSYMINAASVIAMTVHKNTPYAIDSEGRILIYTGYGFDEIARLPIDRILLANATANAPTNGKFVHINGFIPTKNNTLLINVNNLMGDVGATVNENLPSGVWELDLTTNNLTHKYSPTLKALSSSTITDYGQNRILGVGAIRVNTMDAATAAGRSTLLAGYTYYTDATTTKSGIFIDSPDKPTTDNEGQKRGYFVTTWFESNEITDNWTRIWATYRRFLNSADKIILKFRLNEEAPVLATITWTSTTTLTTTTDVSAYAPTLAPFDGITGGEVEVLQGTGSGSNTHITSVSFSTPTYTVTLDTAVTGVTGTAKARFQKWIKLGEITGQVLQYGSFPITLTSTRIQMKVCMEFTGDDELHKLILNSEQDLKAIS